MKRILTFLPLALLLLSSCATIISGGGSQSISITSNPPGARFQIQDEKGKVVGSGLTPAIIDLRAGEAYFKQNNYTVTFNKEGYYFNNAILRSNFNGWYIGNLCFGGIIGMLIIDPLTGAMFRFDQKAVNVMLVPLPKDKVQSPTMNTVITDSIQSIKTDTISFKIFQPKSTVVNKKDSLLPAKTIESTPKYYDYYPSVRPTKKDSL